MSPRLINGIHEIVVELIQADGFHFRCQRGKKVGMKRPCICKRVLEIAGGILDKPININAHSTLSDRSASWLRCWSDMRFPVVDRGLALGLDPFVIAAPGISVRHLVLPVGNREIGVFLPDVDRGRELFFRLE